MKAALFFLMLAVLGCANESPTPRPSAHEGYIPPQSRLKNLEFQLGDYLRRHEVHGTITPDGVLRWMQTDNKSWGPNDADPKNTRQSVRQGHLTTEQVSNLADLLADWESLLERYPAAADEPEIIIRYGDKTVSGGALSSPLREISDHIQTLAMTMPIVVNQVRERADD